MSNQYDILRQLTDESFENQARQRFAESVGRDYTFENPVHHTSYRDRKDNIPAFFQGWE
jgi:hypothetical protein